MYEGMFVIYLCPEVIGINRLAGLSLPCLSKMKSHQASQWFKHSEYWSGHKSGHNTATKGDLISPSQNSSSRFPNPVLYSLHFLKKSVRPFWRRWNTWNKSNTCMLQSENDTFLWDYKRFRTLAYYDRFNFNLLSFCFGQFYRLDVWKVITWLPVDLSTVFLEFLDTYNPTTTISSHVTIDLYTLTGVTVDVDSVNSTEELTI